MTKNAAKVECQLANPCAPCMHRATHPPLIAVYDETTGDYRLETGRVCMARWASTNGSHAAGHLCGEPATKQAGDTDVCQHHYNRAMTWRQYDEPAGEIQEKIQALKEADEAFAAAVHESEIHRERVKAESSVVYYIRRMSDGMIKIGTTGGFRRRIATHRKEQGELQILLTHSGGRAEETEAHRRFDVYRAGRSEWFYPTRPLLNWILDTRQVERHKKTQGLDIMPQAELRKLISDTSPDAYQWRRGKLVPVKAKAESAA